jgi:hypothetical protein
VPQGEAAFGCGGQIGDANRREVSGTANAIDGPAEIVGLRRVVELGEGGGKIG